MMFVWFSMYSHPRTWLLYPVVILEFVFTNILTGANILLTSWNLLVSTDNFINNFGSGFELTNWMALARGQLSVRYQRTVFGQILRCGWNVRRFITRQRPDIWNHIDTPRGLYMRQITLVSCLLFHPVWDCCRNDGTVPVRADKILTTKI